MPLKTYDPKVAVIKAEDHSAAFRLAMSKLPPERCDKPIRLEQQTSGAEKR